MRSRFNNNIMNFNHHPGGTSSGQPHVQDTGHLSHWWEPWLSKVPTNTLLVLNVPLTHSEHDVCVLFQHYAQIISVEKSACGVLTLVQLSDAAAALEIVKYAMGVDPMRMGDRELAVFHCSASLLCGSEILAESRVVRLLIRDAIHPITVQLLLSVLMRSGLLEGGGGAGGMLRIHIGPRLWDNSVSVLIEFSSVGLALACCHYLDNKDLVEPGSCAISAILSGMPTPLCLPLTRPHVRCRDFELFPLSDNGAGMKRPAMGPPNGAVAAKMACPSNFSGSSVNGLSAGSGMISNLYCPGSEKQMTSNSGSTSNFMELGDANTNDTSNCVVFVNNLPPEVDSCDLLFNLVSIFGVVVRIKFLHSKSGTAMVQMSCGSAAQLVANYLRKMPAFGCTMATKVSQDSQIELPARNIALMANGNPSIKDYMTNANNRFTISEYHASINKINPPSTTLHFFNLAVDFKEDDLLEHLENLKCPKPVDVEIFPNPTANKFPTSKGLIQFAEINEAVETLILANNSETRRKDSAKAYHIKLSFSTRAISKKSAPSN